MQFFCRFSIKKHQLSWWNKKSLDTRRSFFGMHLMCSSMIPKGRQCVMNDSQSLSHTKWNCKYHIVFVPKFRRKAIYLKIKNDMGKILRQFCEQKKVIIEGEMCADHVHMLAAIPPNLSVSSFMGYLKGKSSLMIFDRHAHLIMLRNTPLVLSLLGADKDLTVSTNYRTLNKVLREKHKLPVDVMKQVPKAMTDPIMIFKSATVANDYVMMLDLKDNKGATVVVP